MAYYVCQYLLQKILEEAGMENEACCKNPPTKRIEVTTTSYGNKSACASANNVVGYCLQIVYGDVSKWGRLQALPGAEKASKKECLRSKFGEANSEQQISGTWAGHNGAPRSIRGIFALTLLYGG